MSDRPTKLKKIKVTSVDMVRRGANQEAHINLYKSAGDNPGQDPPTPTNALDAPNPDDIPQGLWKSIAEAVKGFLKAERGNPDDPDDVEDPENPDDKEAGAEGETEEVEKAATTFDEHRMRMEVRDDRWRYQDALNASIESILFDDELSAEEKTNMMQQSIDEFSDAYKNMCTKLLDATAHTKKDTPAAVGKSEGEIPHETEEGEVEMSKSYKIDTSRFDDQEMATYNALIAKGRVEVEDPEDDPEDKPVEKAAPEVHPEVKKALEEVEALKKSYEMREMREIAKKYSAPLGKKEDELANTLYEMKKSSETSYNEYIAVLDQSVELVNKSGMFEEIGKSGNRTYGYSNVAKSEPEAKIDSIAKSYQEKDPTMDYNTAVLKAWENHPELMDAYDEQY